MLLLVWTKTIVPMFTRERINRPMNSTGTMLWSLARPFPNVTGVAVTIYTKGATASTSKSAFALLTILALSGNIDPRRVRIMLKRLAVDSRSLSFIQLRIVAGGFESVDHDKANFRYPG
jgi:hypothetical protein